MTTPVEQLDSNDPGDVTKRKFRYQDAYGVILCIRMINEDPMLNAQAIWCEQFEDLLVEKKDGQFAAFQVKTRKAETGYWEINDDAFVKSVGRFIELDKQFPSQIDSFHFVTNAEPSDTEAKQRMMYSPIKLIRAVVSAKTWQDLKDETEKGFEWLAEKLECNEGELFSVLQRTELIVGPTERGLEDQICQTHLPALNVCSSMPPRTLMAVLEALTARVAQASSLVVPDAARDWVDVVRGRANHPALLAKKIQADDVLIVLQDCAESTFRYLRQFATLDLGVVSQKKSTFQQKLEKGGLIMQEQSMWRRTITSEQHLMELATRPEDPETMLSQLESVVLAECEEANLRAAKHGGLFGATMLIDVQERLKRIAEDTPAKVHKQPYEVLVGISGMLTSECKVWWSDRFEIEPTK